MVLAMGCIAWSTACTSQAVPGPQPPVQAAAVSGPASGAPAPANADTGPLTLRSTAFPADGLIPVNFSCAGDNTSPPLTWHGAAPVGTTTWAIVLQDLDVKPGPWIQWMVTGIPVATRSLAAGQVAAGSVARRASNSTAGFVGMCPPSGTVHHYRFTVYADGGPQSVPVAAGPQQVLKAIETGAVGTASLDGTFAR